MDKVDFGELTPQTTVKVNASPLQRPGRDTLVRTYTVGGPEEPKDRRLYLSVQMLEGLLDKARMSPTRRVEIPLCGVRVDIYEDKAEHLYENWWIIGAAPRPEKHPVLG